MASQRTVLGALVGVLLASTFFGIGCTKGSDDAAPVTASTVTPEDQKPPLLRDSWTHDDLTELADIDVPGYENEATDLKGTTLTRIFASDANPEGVTLTAKVRLSPCDPGACWDLAREPDEQRLAGLRSLLLSVHRNNPDLVFEYEPDELIGDFKAFTLYWRSFVPGKDVSATGYLAVYHDGLNRIEVTVSPEDAPTPVDDKALAEQMPKEWAREVAADVFAAFADEFNAD